jgi:hemoglobin-like flavoprotein
MGLAGRTISGGKLAQLVGRSCECLPAGGLNEPLQQKDLSLELASNHLLTENRLRVSRYATDNATLSPQQQGYPLMAEQANELTASYYRCRRDDRFLDTFYDGFLSKSPAIAQMFAKTDFKLQKLLLRQSLLEMLCFDRGLSGTREEIERLGLRHQELRVTPDMYAMWLDSLCEAIKQHDPSYTPVLEQLWREAMLKSIKEMVAVGASPGDDRD